MEFAFVSVAGNGTTKSTDVRNVRSRSMRGINKRDDSRRSRQAARRKCISSSSTTIAELQTSSAASDRTLACHRQCESSKTDIDVLPRLAILHRQAIDAVDASNLGLSPSTSLSDRWLIPMACCESASSRELLVKYCFFKRSMYPANYCVKFEHIDESWAHDFAHNEGFVHAILFASAAIEDFVLRRPFSRTTSLHLKQTLRELVAAVAKGRAGITTATVYIVMSLCIVAGIYGDDDALSVHLAGLKRLNAMTNKLLELSMHPMISFKTDALELVAYMCKGLQPESDLRPSIWQPLCYSKEPAAIVQVGPCSEAIERISDRRLIAVFWDLRHLYHQVDECYLSAGRFDGPTFRDVTYSVQSRLIRLEESVYGPLEDSLRLGMTALLSTNFRIPTRRIGHAYMRNQLMEVCDSFEPSSAGDKELRLWVLLVCGMSVFEPQEPWLCAQWTRYGHHDTDWSALQKRMRGLIWIQCMHDDLGRETFEALQSASFREV